MQNIHDVCQKNVRWNLSKDKNCQRTKHASDYRQMRELH